MSPVSHPKIGKEKARERQHTNPWQAAQWCAEERRGASTASSVKATCQARDASEEKESGYHSGQNGFSHGCFVRSKLRTVSFCCIDIVCGFCKFEDYRYRFQSWVNFGVKNENYVCRQPCRPCVQPRIAVTNVSVLHGKVPILCLSAHFVVTVCVCRSSCLPFQKPCFFLFMKSLVLCIVLASGGVGTM